MGLEKFYHQREPRDTCLRDVLRPPISANVLSSKPRTVCTYRIGETGIFDKGALRATNGRRTSRDFLICFQATDQDAIGIILLHPAILGNALALSKAAKGPCTR
jgi:hypothetical protein